jgi:hypothetical protein
MALESRMGPMLERRLDHPWRWRAWLLTLWFWVPLMIAIGVLNWLASGIAEVCEVLEEQVEDLVGWCKQGRYYEVTPVADKEPA